ncbi:MAG: PPC domain-containing protein [Candidatus Delongbacteria bacterium]
MRHLISLLAMLSAFATISQAVPTTPSDSGSRHELLRHQVLLNSDPHLANPSQAARDNRVLCDNALPFGCNWAINGGSVESQNGNVWESYLNWGDTGPEVIYQLEHIGGLLTLQLRSTDSDQLDLILLNACGETACVAQPWWLGSWETISVEVPAGTYYVVVDAYNWDGNPYTFTLTSNCPAESPCFFTQPLACNDTQHGTSDSSPIGNVWGEYLFGGETGPESVYEMTHPGGLLTLRLSSSTSDQLDLMLLSACDPDSCLAQPWLVGSDEIISGTFPAGTYYVVVDAYNWDGNSYDFYLESGTCYPAASTSCHHMSTQQVLTLPDPLGQAQAYYQFFLPEQAGWVARVLLNINSQNWGNQAGWLKLTLCRPDVEGWYGTPGGPWLEMGTLWFGTDWLPQGWAEFDISSLGFDVQPGEGFWVKLEYEPLMPGQQLSFYAGGVGGYEGFSSFSDGATWDNWWSSGYDFFDELNLCVEYSTACDGIPLTLEMDGGSARLGWPPVQGLVQIWASAEAYTPGTLLSVQPGEAMSFTDENALAAGRRFYRAVHVCGGN